MDKFLVNLQVKDLWSQDEQRRPQNVLRQVVPGLGGPSVRVNLIVDVTPPPPAPDPNPPVPLVRAPNFAGEDAEDEADDGPRAKRPRNYSVSDLSQEQKEIVRERLFKRDSKGDFVGSAADVVEFFHFNFPSIGKCLNERTLRRWREEGSAPVSLGPKKKRGRKFSLPPEIRLEMGTLLKSMGEAGAPMNTKIALPVLVGFLKTKNLLDLYSKTKEKGKITFSQSWILKLFNDFNLSDRKGTTDAQHLPEVLSLQISFYFQ
jgi:hypothetical protein